MDRGLIKVHQHNTGPLSEHTHKHTHTHTACMRTHMPTRTHTHTRTNTHTHSLTHTHTHTHTRTHTRTHTHLLPLCALSSSRAGLLTDSSLDGDQEEGPVESHQSRLSLAESHQSRPRGRFVCAAT